ncbi:sulfur oxidation c-type cytochrome SoxX [Microvirga rosea]|uniref:sulfur oxidation c-type cytochrome SoxX n=1 Tax=Microvirga rosea TaxID=2715425 RepID=UPI0038737883
MVYAGLAFAQSPSIPAGTPAPASPPPSATASYEIVEVDGVASIPKPLTAKRGDSQEGLKVVAGRRLGNCLACHQISSLRSEEFHGEFGPALDGVASRWDEAKLRMIIVNPKKVFTEETVMPAFHRTEGLHRVRDQFVGKPILTAQQVEDVVAYLSTLK